MKIKNILLMAALSILMTNQAQAIPSEEEEGSASPYTGSANSYGPGAMDSPIPLIGNSSAAQDPNGVDTNEADRGVTNLEEEDDSTVTTVITSPPALNAMEPASGE